MPTALDTLLSGHWLIVDDQSIARAALERVLGFWGSTADMAENGAEALVALERTTYAGVLIDGSMPVMDGYETASRIRRAEAASGTVPLPTFLVTGDEDHVQRALDARMSGSIGKPVGARELLEQISRYASCVAIVESNTQL